MTIDEFLRFLVPNIARPYHKSRSIIDYEDGQFDVEVNSDSIYIYLLTKLPEDTGTPCDPQIDELFWPATRVYFDFGTCDALDVDYNFPYVINIYIEKYIKGFWTGIGYSQLVSDIFYQVRSKDYTFYGECCDGTYIPDYRRYCGIFEQVFSYTSVSTFQTVLQDFIENPAYNITLAPGSISISAMSFFVDKGLTPEQQTECSANDTLESWVTFDNKEVPGTYSAVSPNPANDNDYFLSDQFISSNNITPNLVTSRSIQFNPDYGHIKTVILTLSDYDQDFAEIGWDVIKCRASININIVDCRSDACSGLIPGIYVNLSIFGFDFGYVRIADPLNNLVKLLVIPATVAILDRIPTSTVEYDPDQDEIIVSFAGQTVSLEFLLCSCPDGTTWNKSSQTCCQSLLP